jgi:hypothetical protein
MLSFRFTRALFAIVVVSLFGLLAAGCSSDEANLAAPGTGLAASGSGDYAPAMPSGLCVQKATATSLKLAWDPNTEEDLAGYRLFIYDPDPWRANSYVCLNESQPIDEASYVYREGATAGTYYFKIAAVDLDGNESARYGPVAYSYSPSGHDANERSGGVSDGPWHMPASGSDEDWQGGRSEDTYGGNF